MYYDWAVVYDAASAGYRDCWLPALGAIGVAVTSARLGAGFPRNSGAAERRRVVVRPRLVVGLACAVTLALALATYWPYRGLVQAL